MFRPEFDSSRLGGKKLRERTRFRSVRSSPARSITLLARRASCRGCSEGRGAGAGISNLVAPRNIQTLPSAEKNFIPSLNPPLSPRVLRSLVTYSAAYLGGCCRPKASSRVTSRLAACETNEICRSRDTGRRSPRLGLAKIVRIAANRVFCDNHG